jgi:RNA polymerase sigma-70 factor, ECF subfamily
MDERPDDPLDGVTGVWLAEVKGGDSDSFGRLYEHIAPALLTWAEFRIRPEQRQHVDPSDVVQEVWFRAWRQMESFDPEATPFRFWIFRIAKNVLLEAVRKTRRADVAGAGTTAKIQQLGELQDTMTAVSMRLSRDEGLAAFRHEVDALPEEERKLVVHCGLEGLPLGEVAERLGISTEAAGKRWQRLRARLAESSLPEHLLAGA